MVNGVEPGAAADDDLEVGAHVDEVFADLGAGADDHAIVVRQLDHELFGGDVVADVDGQPGGPHLLDVFFFSLVADNDFHWILLIDFDSRVEINNRNQTGEPAKFLFVNSYATRWSF